MIDTQSASSLRTFITQHLAQGITEQEIRDVLMKEGAWSKEDLDTVFATVSDAHPATTSVPSAPSGGPDIAATASSQPGQAAVSRTPAQFGNKTLKTLIFSALLFVVLAGTAGASYALLQHFGVFDKAPYTEDNFILGITAAAARIQSATVLFKASATVEQRDADAFPYQPVDQEERATHLAAFKRDYVRMEDVRSLRRSLRLSTMRSGNATTTYPTDPFTGTEANTTDPSTELPFRYAVTEGGHNYALGVTFETDEAIEAVRKYGYATSVTPIQDKTVTFTAESFSPFLTSRPEESPYEMLAGMLTMVPPEFNSSASLRVAVDLTNSAQNNADISIDADADFGDMTYKVGVDVIKADEVLYARVRNIPGIILALLPIEKNVWMQLPLKSTKKDDSVSVPSFDVGSLIESEVQQAVTSTENKEAEKAYALRALQYAQEERLLSFRTAPTREELDGKTVYRYDVMLKREAFVPFARKLVNDEYNATSHKITREQLDEFTSYAESEEFKSLFDYLAANITYNIYVDAEGMPLKHEFSVRLIPPDSAARLAGKQLHVTATIESSDINEPVLIKAPEGAIPLEDVMKGVNRSLEYGETSGLFDSLQLTAASLSAFYNSTQTNSPN